jgi:hypothetical protein
MSSSTSSFSFIYIYIYVFVSFVFSDLAREFGVKYVERFSEIQQRRNILLCGSLRNASRLSMRHPLSPRTLNEREI